MHLPHAESVRLRRAAWAIAERHAVPGTGMEDLRAAADAVLAWLCQPVSASPAAPAPADVAAACEHAAALGLQMDSLNRCVP